MNEIELKQLQDFKATTEKEREEIGKRLLSPLNEVYELDCGPVIGKLKFRRVKLEDRVRLVNASSRDEREIIELGAEILEKYSADKIPKRMWLGMCYKDPELEQQTGDETGERMGEFQHIIMSLFALSAGGGTEEGMMQFFRSLQAGFNDRGTMPISP